MDPLCPDVVLGSRLDCVVNVLHLLVLENGHADNLLEACAEVYKSLNIRFLLKVLELLRDPVKREVADEFRVVRHLSLRQRGCKEEPAVVVLLELVRIERYLLRLAAEHCIGDADHLLAGYRSEETAEKSLGHLQNLVAAEGYQGLSRLVRTHLKLLLEKVQPCEVVKSLELSESLEDLPEDLLLIAC